MIFTMIFLVMVCTSTTTAASDLNSMSETLTANHNDVLSDINEADESDIEYTEIHVKNNVETSGNGSESSPFKTINEAINYGNNNTKPVIVHIHSGTYDDINMTITNNMIIKSYDGGVTLNANNNGWFFYSTNSSNNLSLIGLTFINGIRYDYYDSSEGGVVKTAGHIDVINCTFEHNFGGTGGGINSNNGANIINSTFNHNKAEYNGAGIYSIYGQTNIINCNFNNNTAKRQGGAVRVQGSTYIENSTFNNNLAGHGPSMGIANYAGNGGAVRVTEGDLNIESSIFNNNTAKFEGGAVSAGDDSQYSQTHYQLNIRNSTFTNNKARNGAGIVANDGINITNSTIANNTVPYTVSAKYGSGTAVYILNGDSSFVGNVIKNNTNPYAILYKEGIYSYSGNVAEKDNIWGNETTSHIKTNNGKTTQNVATIPKINKPQITIKTGANIKKINNNPINPPKDDAPTKTTENSTKQENTKNQNIIDKIITEITDGLKSITNQESSNENINSENGIIVNGTTNPASSNVGENSNEPVSQDNSGNGENGDSAIAHEISKITKAITKDYLMHSIALIIIVALAFIIGYKRKQKEK